MSKKSEDYRSEMNWDVFSDIFERVLFPRIAATNKSSVFVLDRDAYHTLLEEEHLGPITSLNKARLIDTISGSGGPQTTGLVH